MERVITARNAGRGPEELAARLFQGVIGAADPVDAVFTDSRAEGVIAVAGLPFKAPAVIALLRDKSSLEYITRQISGGGSILIKAGSGNSFPRVFKKTDGVEEIRVPEAVARIISDTLSEVGKWAGVLNAEGEHVMDLRTPAPGPHFGVNLLLGNRTEYPSPLQTTPKSVVDRLGGGSFRAHAAVQVLATRWDMRQEENGFPANRQFYLTEGVNQVFYSASVDDGRVLAAVCEHSQNVTRIKYKTECGLDITRTIFLLPQGEGLPPAVEVQRVEVANRGEAARELRLVYTGMFGTASPHALQEDVLYSNIIMQGGILRNEAGAIMAVTPDYYPRNAAEDIRFHSTLLKQGEKTVFPVEFSTNYNEFTGNGSLEQPQGLFRLTNSLGRKGPGFFALALPLRLGPGEDCIVDNFTGLVSHKLEPSADSAALLGEIKNLIIKYSRAGEVENALKRVEAFHNRYSGFIEVKTRDKAFNAYFNKNLPFQVLYQTFASRSFCQTQKGHREIGFREIQDLYASMYYFVGMGKSGLVKGLLLEWCARVFEFGYAYHNFFWQGKEPGMWSDDALWFVQGVCRYMNLTGDTSLLEVQCPVAGADGGRGRTVYETIKAIIRYSGEISVGRHGFPLLDIADWNDCLKLDPDYIDGAEKERRYREQLNAGGKPGEPLDSEYSESVMNAFLLKVAIDGFSPFVKERGDPEYAEKLDELSLKLCNGLREHAWKGDFFARVLFNRYGKGGYSYLGAKGDGLSADAGIDGTYFLNSFSWSILSSTATESQIETMLEVVEKHLKTPCGLKLVTPAELGKIAGDTATEHYFPGDRENGAVFKHASMMAVAAMLKAAKEVRGAGLAARLGRLAYWMLDLALPFRTMSNPYVLCGNPRFCTQYNNSETGENIGPMLSGTATWLNLALLSTFGLEWSGQRLVLDPILREEDTSVELSLNTGKASFNLTVRKPEGFYRLLDGKAEIALDGVGLPSNRIALSEDGLTHRLEIVFKG